MTTWIASNVLATRHSWLAVVGRRSLLMISLLHTGDTRQTEFSFSSDEIPACCRSRERINLSPSDVDETTSQHSFRTSKTRDQIARSVAIALFWNGTGVDGRNAGDKQDGWRRRPHHVRSLWIGNKLRQPLDDSAAASRVGSADAVRHSSLDRRRQQPRPSGAAAAEEPSEHVQPRHRQPRRHRLPAGAHCCTLQHLPAGKTGVF